MNILFTGVSMNDKNDKLTGTSQSMSRTYTKFGTKYHAKDVA
jgi:hypothetical protein